MDELLDIGDVAARTGLTLRALRFYEGRGLVTPLRTAGGRRVYGRGELARLNAAVALKRAGFSLARIADVLGGRTVDLARLVAVQIAEVDAQAQALREARQLLEQVQSRIDRGEPIDVATLCSLIRNGDRTMQEDAWKPVVDRYFTAADQDAFRTSMAEVPPTFDQEAYSARWKDLGDRIAAAMPLDPDAAAAQTFVDEWFALLKPFSEVATPAMWTRTAEMYGDMPNWQADPDPGFDHKVWEFIQAATKARLARGGTIDGPAWMTGGKA